MHTTRMNCLAAAALAGLLAACGGGDGPAQSMPAAPTADAKGRFIDSAVEGLAYDCGGVTGTTNANGEFDFVTGQPCTFRIGGVMLGSATGKPVLTPKDLVPGAADQNDTAVNNMTRLLMSLDADGNPDNGILIPDSVRSAMAGKTLPPFADPSWGKDAAALVNTCIPGRQLTSAAMASAHHGAVLVGLFAGNYTCDYSGTDSGKVQLTIANGVISGMGGMGGTGGTGGMGGMGGMGGSNFGVSGHLESSGMANLSGGTTTSGASFHGTFLPGGSGSGTWTDTAGGRGTWTCTRT